MYSTQSQLVPGTATELSMSGSCSYQVENNRVLITISEIRNHRALDTLSGTLAIEFWALGQPYGGGGFNGVALAGTRIGELGGQSCLTDCRYDLIFQHLPAGDWFLTLMLREWEHNGYVTRDYVNFTLPYGVPEMTPPLVGSTSDDDILPMGTGRHETQTSIEAVQEIDRGPERPQVPGPEGPEDSAVDSQGQAGGKEVAAAPDESQRRTENPPASPPFPPPQDVWKAKGTGTRLLEWLRRLVRP
jgi:hypothetical protein